jgi:hypothetical protein
MTMIYAFVSLFSLIGCILGILNQLHCRYKFHPHFRLEKIYLHRMDDTLRSEYIISISTTMQKEWWAKLNGKGSG